MRSGAPADQEELSAQLASATRRGVPLALTGAALPSATAPFGFGPHAGPERAPGVLIVSLAAAPFRGLVSLEPEEGRVTVRAGTRVAELVAALAEAGQWIPAAAGVLGGSLPGGSVGGLVSRASPGPFDVAYGGLRRHLLSVRTVSHGGRALRWGRGVMKDVAGYDVKALWSGGRGRLGALTQATLRSWALPAERVVHRFRAGVPSGVALALEPGAAAVRPDGLRWDWRSDGCVRLEVWLLGSTASVDERATALDRWAADRGLPECDVESELRPQELAGGGRVTGRPRSPEEIVVRLRTAPDRLGSMVDALRRTAGDAALAVEALPGSGIAWLVYRRGDSAEVRGAGSEASGVERLLEAARGTAAGVAMAVERGGPEEHAAAGSRRPEAARALEGALLEALQGRAPHWIADYV